MFKESVSSKDKQINNCQIYSCNFLSSMNYKNQENFKNSEKLYRGNEHTCQCTNVQNHVYANKNRCTCVCNMCHLSNRAMFRTSKLFFISFCFIYLYKSNGYLSSLLHTEHTLSFFFANQCMLIKTVFSGKSFPTLLTNKTSPHECLWQWSLCLCLYILAFVCFCLLCIKLFFLV